MVVGLVVMMAEKLGELSVVKLAQSMEQEMVVSWAEKWE